MLPGFGPIRPRIALLARICPKLKLIVERQRRGDAAREEAQLAGGRGLDRGDISYHCLGLGRHTTVPRDGEGADRPAYQCWTSSGTVRIARVDDAAGSHRVEVRGVRGDVGVGRVQGGELGVRVGDGDVDRAGALGRGDGGERGGLSKVTEVAPRAPKSTVAPLTKPVPVKVTGVPPKVVPVAGSIDFRVGAGTGPPQ